MLKTEKNVVVELLALTIPQTEEASSLSRTTLYELINAGQLESITVGRRRLVLVESLREFLRGRVKQSQPITEALSETKSAAGRKGRAAQLARRAEEAAA